MRVQDLIAYKIGFDLAMKIYEISKKFPKEEIYSLTEKIRKSSRRVCANLSEAYNKRRYQKQFICKLTDGDAENAETQICLEFAFASDYINKRIFIVLRNESIEISKLFNFMILYPEKFGSKALKIL